MGLDRIEALVWEANERSIRVLERLGYRPEELLRESHRDASGTLRNEWRYVLERPRG
jgi:RimJ/RimL family protein N-acetyltransferase